ncbi:thioesterase II family protein [Variovorax sp. OV700]|uniref:thioesterase II family protein n=1 Tax=Variovorax sp. OV700 TaxID=1882826 RepID=UPI0008917B3A|nr:alpha/beta fold hydrolase [Variovorax sp. OV700]SDH56605.1 Surfactin synthase thioesterase subunit [Variovorax sp. OV700]
MSIVHKSPWFIRKPASRPANLRIFCFHHAGGNANIFLPWNKLLSDGVEVVGVQLPGRGLRRHEPLMTSSDQLLQALGNAFVSEMDQRPFVFFGHSMGAWLAFELARWLERRGIQGPSQLIVAGRGAPQLAFRMAPIDDLPDAEMIDSLRKFNGIDDALASYPELLKLFLPVIRSDLLLHRTHRYLDEPPLACSIRAIASDSDPLCGTEDVRAWSSQTAGDFEFQLYAGGHFFFHLEPSRHVPMILEPIGSSGTHGNRA